MYLSVVIIALASSAYVEDTPYAIDVAPHIVVTSAVWGVLAVYKGWVLGSLPGGLTCEAPAGAERCDPEKLNSLDRMVVGKKSNEWLLASDILTGGLILTVAGLSALDAWNSSSPKAARGLAIDILVMAEATGIATFLAHLLKAAIRRPRPTQYAVVGSIASVEHQLSFPSGHAAAAAALGASFATTFWLRHPDSIWRWVMIGGVSAMSAAISLARVEAGFHFYTDTIVGMLLGAAVGVSLPLFLGRSDTAATARAAIGARGTRAVLLTFHF